MKIVWHMPTLRRRACGLSRRALALAGRLVEHGHAVTFMVDRDKTDISGDRVDGMPLRRVSVAKRRPAHWCLQARTRSPAAASVVGQIGSSHDLLISCQPEVVSAYAAGRDRRPVVYVCGGTTLLHDEADRARQASLPAVRRPPYVIDRVLKRRNERRAFCRADAVVFDSVHSRELVVARYGPDPGRCHTVHGGVDVERFRPADAADRAAMRRRWGVREDGIVVVWTGRLSPEKNLGLLLRSLPHCRRPLDRVLLVGDGPARGALVGLARALELEDRVTCVGEVGDVRPFLRAADIFAFPSRGESFGGALVEAMSCGLACVGLRSDGRGVSTANSEIIEHGRCGLLVDRPEPAAFAAALDDLARDGGRRGLFGAAGRRRACERFTWPAAGRRLNEIISKLVGGAVRSDIQSGQRFDVSTF